MSTRVTTLPSIHHSEVPVLTLNNLYTRQEREHWVRNHCCPRLQAKLDCPYGKDNLEQCFKSEASFRLILLQVYKSGYLHGDAASWNALREASTDAAVLSDLLEEYGDVEFGSTRGLHPIPPEGTPISQERVAQTTAALLHLDCDAAALVRWMGGTHVGAHRDTDAILAYLQDKIRPDTLNDLTRIYRQGIPARCNAEATERNFQAFYRYGNHSTVHAEPEKTLAALTKDYNRGYVIVVDPRVIPFILNCHVTPIGVIDTDKPYKSPRLIFDSTFRPEPWCFATNDWTTIATEPLITFAPAFFDFLCYLYNLRISFPDEELYLGDDDVSGAFRHLKYHPNLVAMHASFQAGYGVLNTGGTFGGCTTPSNWNVIARARQELAQFLWFCPDIEDQAQPFLPPITFGEPPTSTDIASFTKAEADALNSGIFDSTGRRLPPRFDHHVDDNIYADIRSTMARTLSSSTVALYRILGYPTPFSPNVLSQEKLNTTYTHRRKMVGYMVDSRTMTVEVLDYKRDQLTAQLDEWLAPTRQTFSLKDASTLLGTLEHVTRFLQWARPLMFTLQNALHTSLIRRYHFVKRNGRIERARDSLQRQLPRSLHYRLSSLLAREQAQFMWHSNAKCSLTNDCRADLRIFRHFLQDPSVSWATPIAALVPRTPHYHLYGDASRLAGGAYCMRLRFWFIINWSTEVRVGLDKRQSDHGFVHINSLEFIVLVLQVAAASVALSDPTFMQGHKKPTFPILQVFSDNTSAKAWTNKFSTKSEVGQNLLRFYAALLRDASFGVNCEHIAGVDNGLADFLSRPTHPDVTFSSHIEQLFRKHPSMKNWHFFLPSPELLQLLHSLLFTKPLTGLPLLPKMLGQFVPASSISSGFASPMGGPMI
jgi:hypothetical protein